MILGIGTDIVLINRVDDLLARFDDKFINKVFTQNEIDMAAKKTIKSSFYAKRFAAKEAFSKAIGLGIGRGIDFCDIEIINDEFGKPEIKILNDKISFLQNHFKRVDFTIDLSLSDEKNIALAFVVISSK